MPSREAVLQKAEFEAREVFQLVNVMLYQKTRQQDTRTDVAARTPSSTPPTPYESGPWFGEASRKTVVEIRGEQHIQLTFEADGKPADSLPLRAITDILAANEWTVASVDVDDWVLTVSRPLAEPKA